MKVLFVDDDSHVRWLTDAILFSLGHEVHTASDAYEAADLLFNQRQHFDCILLDKQMPGWSGLDFLQSLRNSLWHRDLPVIMLTGETDPKGVVDSLEGGVQLYLQKPASKDLLRAALNTVEQETVKRQTFQRRSELAISGLQTMTSGTFCIQTMEQARELVAMLCALARHPDHATLGLIELFKNSIEYGNLALSPLVRLRLLSSGGLAEELAHRMTLEDYADRRLTVKVDRFEQFMRVSIADEGAGFDWKAAMDEARSPSGRHRLSGLSKVIQSKFQDVYFEDGGRVAVVHVPLVALVPEGLGVKHE
mgnify:CR=1 FL=1